MDRIMLASELLKVAKNLVATVGESYLITPRGGNSFGGNMVRNSLGSESIHADGLRVYVSKEFGAKTLKSGEIPRLVKGTKPNEWIITIGHDSSLGKFDGTVKLMD